MRTSVVKSAVILALVCAPVLSSPAVAYAVKHDATIMQVGGKGLYSYSLQSGKRKLAIKGLRLTTVQARSFSFGPSGRAVVLEGTHRSDRAGMTEEMRISALPKGKGHLVFKDRTGELLGWKDRYRAIVRIDAPDYSASKDYIVDARTGKKKRYYGGKPKYKADVKRKATYGERRYKVTANNENTVTVVLRSTGEVVSQFQAPGTVGTSTEWWAGEPQVSPDGRYIAFENSAMPYNDARVTYQVWTCTINGENARQMKYPNGLHFWQ